MKLWHFVIIIANNTDVAIKLMCFCLLKTAQMLRFAIK